MPSPLRSLLVAAVVAGAGAFATTAAAEDVTVTSFDGTPIVAHWFPLPGLAAGKAAPTILMGPGWGSGGDTNAQGHGSGGVGTIGIADFHDAGYNVLTWDPRGFGKSGGRVETDSPQWEGRDTQELISWVAGRPGVQLDRAGDPRMGMAGGSYGGGIQLVTASLDKRVDAIAPSIAWQSLGTSLFKEDLPKLGWSGLLYNVSRTRPLDPVIPASYERAVALGNATEATRRWYLSRGPGAAVAKITAPTLLLQGTVDTLFTLDEAIRNYDLLRRAGSPVKMLWFCGGHGACLTDPGDPGRAERATLAWLQRWVKRDTSVSTGPGFDGIDQRGTRFTAKSYPPKAGTPLHARGTGTLRLRASSAAGPVAIKSATGGLGGLVGGITPGRATEAVALRVRAKAGALVAGAPQLRLTYRGTRGTGNRPQRVFAQLVDDATGHVLGNQITPIRVRLDGRRHTVSRPLEVVAQRIPMGGNVSLQLVATTPAYATPQLGGTLRFDAIDLRLPTVRG